MKLPTPDPQTVIALARFKHSAEGQKILKWLQSSVKTLQEAGCDHHNDARARQAQGAWLVLADLIQQAEGAQGALGTGVNG